MMTPIDREKLKRATPYLRSLIALLIYCTSPAGTASREVSFSYVEAEKFINKLTRDLQ